MRHKHIISLMSDPFRVGLNDKLCSIFIDPKRGTVLIDEGDSEDRLNGAVMYPDKSPIFSVSNEDGADVILLDYSGFHLVVGTIGNVNEAREWTTAVNEFLATKAGRATSSEVTQNGAAHASAQPTRKLN